jgi:Holliday junction resolvasome RuvABC endonuclease subunit
MTNLSDFRDPSYTPAGEEGGQAAPPIELPKPVWQGDILAIDQSLSAAGWVWVEVGETLVVRETGMLRTETIDTKNKTNDKLLRSVEMFGAVNQLLQRLRPMYLVHETPPAGTGGRLMGDGTSSLLAADAIRHAVVVYNVIHATRYGCPQVKVSMVQPNVAKKRVTDLKAATKNQVGERVELMVPSLKLCKPLNENVRDAMALAIVASEKEIPS